MTDQITSCEAQVKLLIANNLDRSLLNSAPPTPSASAEASNLEAGLLPGTEETEGDVRARMPRVGDADDQGSDGDDDEDDDGEDRFVDLEEDLAGVIADVHDLGQS